MEPSSQSSVFVSAMPGDRSSRKLSLWLVGAVLLAAVGAAVYFVIRANSDLPGSGLPAALISAEETGFNPGSVKIRAGQAVTWTNQDAQPHHLAGDQQAVLSLATVDQLTKGDSYTFTFEKPGVYTYHDPLNPTVLKGTVIVE